MKKNLYVLAALGILIVSCGPSKEDYDKAAQEICDCVTKAGAETKEAVELGFIDDPTATNYSVCIENQKNDKGIEFDSDEMKASIKEKCSDLESAHEEYLKSAKDAPADSTSAE